jgi:hypothetical protein
MLQMKNIIAGKCECVERDAPNASISRQQSLMAADCTGVRHDGWDQLSIAKELVLPVRIELTTSPLPRECSTTELRQQARANARVSEKVELRRDPCHRGHARASEPPCAHGGIAV